MNRKEKQGLLKRNLFHDIEFKINENNMDEQLFFGGVKNDIFKDLSSSYLIGKINDKLAGNLGFYVKYNGFPIKIDLDKDNIYEKGGKLIVEKS